MNDYWEWHEAYSTIMDYLHGKKKRAILEDDPDYYYEGRFTVNNWKSDKDYSTISVDYDLFPFKRKIQNASRTLTINTTEQSINISNSFYGIEPVCPTLTISGFDSNGVIIKYNRYGAADGSVALKNGTHMVSDLILYDISTTLRIKGISSGGTITVNCTYGRL